MTAILKLFFDIARLRRGPEDAPSGLQPLLVTVAVFFAANALLTALFRPDINYWALQLLVSIVFTLLWYRVLLGVFGKPERFNQTVTAMFGFGLLLSPLLVPLSSWLAPLAATPEKAGPVAWVFLPLVFYVVYVTARILRAAIERSMGECVMLVLVQTFAEPLLLYAIFGAGEVAKN